MQIGIIGGGPVGSIAGLALKSKGHAVLKLMMSDYLQQLTKDLNIVNEEMHSFEPLPAPE